MIRCISESATRHIVALTYLAIGVAARLRRSKNVRKMAIKTSIPAATVRHTVAMFCAPDGKVFDSEHKTYPYRKVIVAELDGRNNLYAGSKQETGMGELQSGKKKRADPFAVLYMALLI